MEGIVAAVQSSDGAVFVQQRIQQLQPYAKMAVGREGSGASKWLWVWRETSNVTFETSNAPLATGSGSRHKSESLRGVTY